MDIFPLISWILWGGLGLVLIAAWQLRHFRLEVEVERGSLVDYTRQWQRFRDEYSISSYWWNTQYAREQNSGELPNAE